MIDVNVIGAGPAGSFCANLLARSGRSVHLTDVAEFPRDKLCGGGLTKKSLDLIGSVEPSFRTSGVAEYVHDFHLIQPETSERCVTHVADDWVALVRRRVFDDWMRQRAIAAGADFSSSTVPARFVVAADGAGSKLGREVRGALSNEEVAIATECHVPNGKGPYIAIVLNPTHDPSDLGYGWSFARSDTAAVGTGVLRAHDDHLLPYRQVVSSAVERFYGYHPAGFTNWVVPLYRPRRATKGNVALVGDALGTADPLFVEGIASGLYSAKALADSFDRTGDFSRYESELAAHPFFRSMRLLRGLQRRGNADFERAYRLFSLPGELRELMEVISGSKSPRRYAIGLTARHPVSILRAWLRSLAS